MLVSHVHSLPSYGLEPARLLCPWGSPGTNTRVGCHSLLQGIFLSQGPNPCLFCLLRWQVGSLQLSHLGSSELFLRISLNSPRSLLSFLFVQNSRAHGLHPLHKFLLIWPLGPSLLLGLAIVSEIVFSRVDGISGVYLLSSLACQLCKYSDFV